MTRDETLSEILRSTIWTAMDRGTDVATAAKDAAKAFKAGLAEYDDADAHAATCASTGDAATCGCRTTAETAPS